MGEYTKVRLRLLDGFEIVINVEDYEKFEEQALYRDERTVFTDLNTGLKVFAMAISTFKREK